MPVGVFNLQRVAADRFNETVVGDSRAFFFPDMVYCSVKLSDKTSVLSDKIT